MQSTQKKTLLFSYVTTVFFIYPLLRFIFNYYDLNLLISLLINIFVSILVSLYIEKLNEKYNFVFTLLNNFYFQLYIFFFLQIENILRSKYSSFFFGLFLSLVTILSYIIFFDKIPYFLIQYKISKKYVYIFYYIVLIYSKIRISLINHEIINLHIKESLQWQKIIDYYKLKSHVSKINLKFKNSYKNFVFENIYPIKYYINYVLFTQKIKQYFLNIFNVIFSYIFSLYIFFKYNNLYTFIDGQFGIRTEIIKTLNSSILYVQKQKKNFDTLEFQEYKKFFKSEMETCNNTLLYLEKLKITIEKLPLYFFLFDENKKNITLLSHKIRSNFFLSEKDLHDIDFFIQENLNFSIDL